MAPSRKIPQTFRLGIMGGTFNPIHYGHLVAAEQARCGFHLREVIFVPSGTPPHKDVRKVSDAEHRYIMTVLATAPNPHFSVSRVEIDREGPSYAVDTIMHFLKNYPGGKHEIFFITGTDAVMEILTWREPETIMKHCTIIAASRPGYDTSKLRNMIGPKRFRSIKVLNVSALAISSTDIRQRVSTKLPIRYLVPEPVETHIRKYALYKAPDRKK